MHRLGAAHQYNYPSTRDGRSSMQNHNPPFGNNNDIFNRHHYPPQTTGRVYPPGSNPRLAGLLASTPSATATAAASTSIMERGRNSTQVFMNNRMNIMQQQHGSGYSSNNNPYGNEQGGITGMESAVGGYSAQKLRNGHYGHHLVPQQQQPTFGGVGFSGNGGGVRFHPYNHLQYQPTPAYQHQQQQQQQQQRSAGFLEQLLKNRGGQQMGYYNPYGGGRAPQQSALGTPSFLAPHRFPGNNNNIQGGYGGVAPSPFTHGPRGVMTSGYYPHHSLPHHHPQHQPLNWGARGGIFAGGGGNPFHSAALQNGGGFQQRHPNPFYQHGHHHHHPRNNNHLLPIIKNEPEEDNEQEDKPDKEILNSETRYRRNHERMTAIMNENCVDCNPITVPMQRVESLKHHVRLLTEDLNKHKDDTLVVRQSCAKRLQEFQEATSKFHADYQKLCQPINEDEYKAMVDKYYEELKERMKEEAEQVHRPTDCSGNDEGVMDLTCGQQKACCQDNGGSPLDCTSRKNDRKEQREEQEGNNSAVTPDDDYFDHPLFIHVPAEENERRELAASPPQREMQDNQQVFECEGHPEEGFAAPEFMEENGGGNAVGGADLFFGGGHHHFDDDQQQQQQIGYASYYPSESSTMNTVGSANQMENLIMSSAAAHSQLDPTASQQQIFMRAHQNNPNINFTYQSQQQQYHDGGDTGSYPIQQHQHQFPMEQQQRHLHHHVPSPQVVGSAANMRTRPTEELRDFILDLVRGKYRRAQESSSSPQLQHQSGGGSPSVASTSSDIPEAQRGQFQQRRLMSGGGIVEVKRASPVPPAIYDDAATREWINSLANVNEDPHHDDDVVPLVAEEEQDISQDSNNNLQMDLNHHDEVAAGAATTTANNNIDNSSLLMAKNSKIAEILQSPCLNDSAEEFETELRQLEEALNGDDVDTAISSMHRNNEDVCAIKDNDEDDNEDQEDEQECE